MTIAHPATGQTTGTVKRPGIAATLSALARLLMRHGIWISLSLTLGTVWGMIVLSTVLQERRLLEVSAGELTQLNNVVTQNSYALFKTIETDLRTLDLALHWQAGTDPLSDSRFNSLVDEFRRASDGLIDVRAISADGKLYLLPSPQHISRTDVADREIVIAAMTRAAPAFNIGLPVVSRVTGKLGVPISWRLSSPVGGIVALEVFVELDRLIALHNAFRMKPDGTIDMFRLDGYILSRAPFDAHLIGRSFKENPFFQSELASKSKGTFITTGKATDGVKRIFSYERLNGYPIVVVSTRGVHEVLASFYQRVFLLGLVAIIVSVVLIAFAVAFRKSLKTLHDAQHELRVQATTDELTKTMNRRELFRRARAEFERTRRFDRPMAVLMLDLDFFKRLNDSRGHAVGDLVLQECSALWQSLLRDQDLLGRIGGEEFCIVLLETAREAAAIVAERLRENTATHRFAASESAGDIAVTVSIGLTCTDSADVAWSDTLARADRALYEAKHRQRNQVVAMEPAPGGNTLGEFSAA